MTHHMKVYYLLVIHLKCGGQQNKLMGVYDYEFGWTALERRSQNLGKSYVVDN